MPSVTTPKTYDCEICHAALKSQRDLDNHMCLRHDDCGEARLGSPITFRCVTCGKAYERRSDLYDHMKKHGHGHPSEWNKPRQLGAGRRRSPRQG